MVRGVMPAVLTAGLLILAGLAAAPAMAQRNPCDHYLPTGEALPRQDRITGNVVVHDEPTWRGHRVGNARAGDQVEVLKECGRSLMIRTPDGVEGWVPIVFLPHEETLARIASSKPITTEQDCDLRYEEPNLLVGCKENVVRKKARADELAHSVYLNADQIRAFVSGKTIVYTDRPDPMRRPPPRPEATTFYRPDGEVFALIGPNTGAWRGRWMVKDDTLCVPEGFGCGRMRRIPSGETLWVGRPGEYVSTPEDGDADGVVGKVTELFPFPASMPVPDGLEDVAHPVMGW